VLHLEKSEINKMKSDLEASKKSRKDWRQLGSSNKTRSKKLKKPADQIAVANETISEMNERAKM
jgi:hypothetical protein